MPKVRTICASHSTKDFTVRKRQLSLRVSRQLFHRNGGRPILQISRSMRVEVCQPGRPLRDPIRVDSIADPVAPDHLVEVTVTSDSEDNTLPRNSTDPLRC